MPKPPVPKPLVIVESPAKARTIARFLGSGYVVESSVGHIRDLPRNADEIPAANKSEPWARLGVDVDREFEPLYVVAKEKKQVVTKLKQALKQADELYLATDEDREGESIAWHLLEVLAPPKRVQVKRMVFHEITAPAIRRALDNTRELDGQLVDAQEARRILDRLYGYEVSPVLWRKVLPKLSAGRVQSVATRILVERERARMRFRAAAYSSVEGTFDKPGTTPGFGATLVALDGTRLATGKDFDESGSLPKDSPLVLLDHARATGLVERLAEADFAVRSVDEKPYRRSPYPPFMTSTLQQEAGRKLRFTAQRTMSTAQRLYENGYITYMRTDSTSLSETAVSAARRQASELYGPAYVPETPRRYEKKVKNAQEAHEAIRPAGESFRTPDQVSGELGSDERALYDLIWKRTVASQMSDARGKSVQVRLGATSSSGEDARVLGQRPHHRVPGLPAGLRGGIGRSRRRPGGPGGAPARPGRRRRPRRRGPGGQGPRHQPAGPLHRSVAGQGPGGDGRGSPLHLRVDPRHHPGPGLRLAQGHRPGADLDRLRRRHPDGAPLRRPGRLRLHRPDGGRPRQHRPGRREAGPVAVEVLLRERRARAQVDGERAPRRHRPP